MLWTPTDDPTLALTDASDEDRQRAGSLLAALRDSGTDAARDVADHLLEGLRAGGLQPRTLVGLGRLCHGQGPDREPARAASQALLGFVAPTPTAGFDLDYFWRVARRVDGPDAGDTPATGRTLRHRAFASRAEACAFGSTLGDRLVSVTETREVRGTGETTPWCETTLWFWEGEG